MKVAYDQQADALYVELGAAEVSRTIQIDPGTLVDLDGQGRVLGVELLRPARPWPLPAIFSQFLVDPTDAHLLRLLERAAGDAGRFTYASPALVSA